jgi:hypothetical protein
MGASYVSAGSPVAAAQPVSASHPAGVFNDTVVFIVAQKDNLAPASISTPAGLTKLGEKQCNVGSPAADTGPTRIAAYARTLDGTEGSNTYAFSGSTDVMWAQGILIATNVPAARGLTGVWTVDAVFGEDVTGDASWSAAMTPINLGIGDVVITAGVIPTDVTTPSQFTAETFTATGMTVANGVELSEPDSTTGNDIGGFVAKFDITAGTPATVTPTVTATVAATFTNAYGASCLVRLRLVETVLARTDGTWLYMNTGQIDPTTALTDGRTWDSTWLYMNTGQIDATTALTDGRTWDSTWLYMNTGFVSIDGTVTLEPWGFGIPLDDTVTYPVYHSQANTWLYMNIYDPALFYPPRLLDTAYVQSLPTVMTLNWAVPIGGIGVVTGYDVRVNGGAPISVGNVLTYDFTVLTPGNTYTFEVLAHWPGGDSTWASVVDRLPVVYPTDVLADAPIAYYRQDDVVGTTMTDSSGNARHGTYVNSPPTGASLLTLGTGASINYNGTSQYGEVASATWMDVSQITVEAWVRPDVAAANAEVIASRWHSSTAALKDWLLRREADGSIGWFWMDSAGVQQSMGSPGYTLEAGFNYHIVGTVDSLGVGRTYRNGVLVGTLDPAGTLTKRVTHVQPIRIGALGGTASQFWDGRIDEVAISPTALSLARIQAHYANGSWT